MFKVNNKDIKETYLEDILVSFFADFEEMFVNLVSSALTRYTKLAQS